MTERKVRGWLNPLAFLEADEPLGPSTAATPTFEAVLRFLCPADEAVDIHKILSRYREISAEPVRLFLAPAEQRILDKLIWPLRNAKASYMIGNYLATISLSGMVAEMTAMLLWEITDSQINGRTMTKEDEKRLFGSEFEKLGQERRVSILSASGIIGDGTRKDFEEIRQIRRHYLHLWSQDHDRLPRDGIKCFHAAVSLVVAVIGQDVVEGRLVLNPQFVRYLERKGLYGETPFLFDDGSAALPEEIAAEGPCQCERLACVDRPQKVYCRWTRDLPDWVIRKRLYRRCYDELIVCPRCGRNHKRGHVGRLGDCGKPYVDQDGQSD
jgi:hypothetical protein